MANTLLEDLHLLGLEGFVEHPSKDVIKRAFRRAALQCHPDKNRHDPVEASESFRRLAAAYQRLSSAHHSMAHGQAWQDLDMCEDLLAEEFFAEAFAQDIHPFELMYIQERMAAAKRNKAAASPNTLNTTPARARSSSAGPGSSASCAHHAQHAATSSAPTPSSNACSVDARAGENNAGARAANNVSGTVTDEAEPCVFLWAEDPASADASSYAMWRHIHKLMTKRRQKEERRARAARGEGLDGTQSQESQHSNHHQRWHYTGSRDNKRMLFWDFLSDLVCQDERSYCYVPEDSNCIKSNCNGDCTQLKLYQVSHKGQHQQQQQQQLYGTSGAAPQRVQQGEDSFASCRHSAGDNMHDCRNGGNGLVPHRSRPQLQLHRGGEIMPVLCLGAVQPRQQLPGQGNKMRRRTNWRFYWTWVKRLMLIRALLYMLPS